jgi:hypothetical protein
VIAAASGAARTPPFAKNAKDWGPVDRRVEGGPSAAKAGPVLHAAHQRDS